MENIYQKYIDLYPYNSFSSDVFHDDLMRYIDRLYKLDKRVVIRDNSFKFYPIEIDDKELETNYYNALMEIVDESISSGVDIKTLIKDKELVYSEFINDKKSKLKKMDMEPYYGDSKFLIDRATYINKCINNIPNIDIFADSILNNMLEFNESDEDFYTRYDRLEKNYLMMREIEDGLTPVVIKYWKNYLTDPNKHDDNNYRYLCHTFTQGVVEPDKFHKACCSLNTDKNVATPYGNWGVTFTLDNDSLDTMCSEDAGSWVIDKRRFIDRGLPINWQLDNPNKSCTFYEESKVSKLVMPEALEKEVLDNELKYNGGMLEKDSLYSEIFLNSNARVNGVFYTDKSNENDIEKAREYSEKYNLPLINISLNKQREIYNISSDGDTNVNESTK